MNPLQVEQALSAIRQTFESGSYGQSPQSTEAAPEAAHLRLALAVRDWASPMELLRKWGSAPDAASILDDVAPDVIAGADARPGRWYLAADARSRVLRQASPRMIMEEISLPLAASDASDPVRWAFRALFGLETAALDELDSEQLRSLANAARWLGSSPGEASKSSEEARKLTEQIAAILELRRRKEDLARLGSVRLIGRDNELAALVEFATTPKPAEQVAYVYGMGGSGKSTLLRHLELALGKRGAAPELILFDLDRVDLNPGDPHTLELDLVRQLAILHPEDADRLHQGARQLLTVRAARRADKKASPTRAGGLLSTDEEAMMVQGSAEEASTLTPLMLHDALRNGRFLMIVDTIEVAAMRGPAVMRSLGEWLAQTASTGTRLLLSGRDPPSQNLTDFLLSPLGKARLVSLGDLDQSGASQLLRDVGVEDEALITLASEHLPRNPLFLKMAATLYVDSDAAAAARSSLAAGLVDPEAARRYLDARLVRHLPEAAAQPYLLAALLLPSLDASAIAAIIVPAVEPGRVPPLGEAQRLLKALATSDWLSTLSPDGKMLEWSREIRALALRLIGADPQKGAMVERVRLLAMVYHGRRRGQEDRALAAYHRLMRGDPPEAVLDGLKPMALRRLGEWVDELPAVARLAVKERKVVETDGAEAIAAPLSRPSSDSEWVAFLEGASGKSGEGLRLVKRGHFAEALRLYRDRPTRPPGRPPRFVLQALAEEGDWHWDMSDPVGVAKDSVLHELDRRGDRRPHASSEEVATFYWLTRLALMRDQKLSNYHREMLAGLTRGMSLSSASAMASLMAVADALQPDHEPLLPLRWLRRRGSHTDPRLLLGRLREKRQRFRTTVRLDSILVCQRDWPKHLDRWMRLNPQHLKLDPHQVERALAGLQDAPFSGVAELLRYLRVPIRLELNAEDPFLDNLMLRGLTVEFHRPIVAALKRLGSGHMHDIVGVMKGNMSIQPREIRDIESLILEKPDVWIAAFVSYCDRCRLLPGLCELLSFESPEPLAMAFRVWDRALSRFPGKSSWPEVRGRLK